MAKGVRRSTLPSVSVYTRCVNWSAVGYHPHTIGERDEEGRREQVACRDWSQSSAEEEPTTQSPGVRRRQWNTAKEDHSLSVFKKAVHLNMKPWSVTDGERANLTLEVDEKAPNVLEQTGRVYIKWFSYRCRSVVHTYACHRCLGFDHKGDHLPPVWTSWPHSTQMHESYGLSELSFQGLHVPHLRCGVCEVERETLMFIFL